MAFVVHQQIGDLQGCLRRILYSSACCFNSMHASSACYIQGHQGKHVACMGSAGKGLVNLEATTKRVRLHHAMKTTLGLGCHAEKTYIKESAVRLLGKSRYERGELL